ncbi:hypothetical protein [Aureimonas mangrovi]|uniref:hypothetical protein n=1 Tax=Aureimonas mangrovi TaxID=2758041 RepID=UPI00163D4759|nr:hypothetical protein [Aureimonas mangrovi]
MTTLVTVLRGGGRYAAHWVERLANGLFRHSSRFERVLCLSDVAVTGERIERVPLRHDWPGWWSKMEAFRPGLVSGTAVLCDLDNVFTGNADALAEPGLAAMEDHFLKGRLSTALLRWDGDELSSVYETFAADPQRWMKPGSCGRVPNAVHGDQVVVDHLLRREDRVPPFLQRLHPGLVDFYDPSKSAPGPVVVFIGDAKPETASGPIGRIWREALEPA